MHTSESALPRIVVDGWPLCVRSAGVATYTRELLNQLSNERGVSLEILYPIYPRPSRANDLAPFTHRSMLYPLAMQHPFPSLGGIVSLETITGAIDVFHATAYALPSKCRCKVVCTVHDLALLRHPELGTPALQRTVRRTVDSLDRVDCIIAVSECTKRDLVELCKADEKRIRVIYNGVGTHFTPSSGDLPPQLAGRKYILHVGTLEPRKNIPTLLQAFAKIDHQGDLLLALVGDSGWETEDLSKLAHSLGIADRVRFLGAVDARTLPALYSQAQVLAYPSLYEGFGLPIIEAMACGTPVVCSDRGAIPEVAGGAAITIDPASCDDLANAINRVLSDKSLRHKMSDQGVRRAQDFSWEKCARQTLAVYRDLADD